MPIINPTLNQKEFQAEVEKKLDELIIKAKCGDCSSAVSLAFMLGVEFGKRKSNEDNFSKPF